MQSNFHFQVSANAAVRDTESKRRERSLRIAMELSNLVIYCKSVMFNQEKMLTGHFSEMSSFPETKAEKLMCGPTGDAAWFLKYHRSQISRIYPKAQRVASDNYNPVPMWGCGSQMAALNYQTGDKPMQLNQAKFLDNGRCGYLLRPEYMFKDGYLPSDRGGPAESGVALLEMTVTIVAARHLYRSPISYFCGKGFYLDLLKILGLARTLCPKDAAWCLLWWRWR